MIRVAGAKLKTLLRKAAEQTVEGTWKRIGALLASFTPTECPPSRTFRVPLSITTCGRGHPGRYDRPVETPAELPRAVTAFDLLLGNEGGQALNLVDP
jgi:hypothetical protein